MVAPAMALTAEETKPSGPPAPKQFGYAFDHLTVLAQQILYGRAYGVALLASACDANTPVGQETREAYAKWHEAQIHVIAKMEHDLAMWYFNSEAQTATDADIIRALNLPPRLDPNLSEQEMHDACATFAQMLQGERYDLSALLAKASQETSAQTKIPDTAPVASTQ